MDDELIEKVAQAIYEVRNGKGAPSWSLRNRAHKEPYQSDARAAIQAVREAGWKFVPSHRDEQHTLCEECGKWTPHKEAEWTVDGASFCPECAKGLVK